jgi:hypothetical protein
MTYSDCIIILVVELPIPDPSHEDAWGGTKLKATQLKEESEAR